MVGVSGIILSLHLFGFGDICGYPKGGGNEVRPIGLPRLEARRDGIEKGLLLQNGVDVRTFPRRGVEGYIRPSVVVGP